MGVKKIFVVLITIVACVIVGAIVLNTLVPNVTAQLINATEGMVYNATGMTFDFNGDGITGATVGKDASGSKPGGAVNNNPNAVKGFK